MRFRTWTALAAATALTASAAALPQNARSTRPSQPGAGSPYRIVVIDRSTNKDVTTLGDGGTLTLTDGQELGLHIYKSGEDGGRTWLDGRFEVVEGADRIAVEPSHARGGEGRLTALRPTAPRSPAVVRWWPAELSPREAAGVLHVEVLPDPRAPRVDLEGALEALYRGILLREANDAGSRDHLGELERSGWPAVLSTARSIAESRESQVQVYERGACNQERLLALYRHLLDRDGDRVDLATWRRQLRELERGEIAAIVQEMVDTPDFRRRFGFREGRVR